MELRLVDCLERSATIETDLYQNVKALLPQDLQKNLPETSPFVPSSVKKEPTDVLQEDDVTYTSASVAEEKASNDRSMLHRAQLNVHTCDD